MYLDLFTEFIIIFNKIICVLRMQFNNKKKIFKFQADDTASGIHFTVGRGISRTNSIHSSVGSVPRVNTLIGGFKRFFSRDESRSPQTPEGKIQFQIFNFKIFNKNF